MKNTIRLAILALTAAISLNPSRAVAASMTLEQKYQDVFVSAGYATALGAGVGAALLAFKEDPTDHLRYVAIGASVGFFAGTAFGTYMVVAPSFSDETSPRDNQTPNYAAGGAQEGQVIVQPVVSTKDWTLSGVEAGMVVARF